MSAIHAALPLASAEALDPLVVTVTPSSLSFNGVGTPINSGTTVEVTATGSSGDCTVVITRVSGYFGGSVDTLASTSGYTNNVANFEFDMFVPGSQSTTFEASVTADDGDALPGTKNFTVYCTRTK